MAKTAKKTAVAVKSASTEVSTDLANEMFADAGVGNENLTAKDFVIPWIKIVQNLSHIHQKTHEDYIESAQPGMIFNTATKKLWSAADGIIVVPVSYTRRYIEWDDPSGNGKFVCDHGTNEDILDECDKDEKGKDITSNGNVIYETGMHYVLVVDPANGDFEQAVISMDRTQLKASRELNNLIVNKKLVHPNTGEKVSAPRGAFAFRLTTKTKSNDDGELEVWNPQDYGPVTDLSGGVESYGAVKAFRKNVATGTVKAADIK